MAQTLPAPNSPQAARPSTELATPAPGLTAIDAQGKTVAQCPLQRTEVRSDIAGTIARVQVRQRFTNPSKEPIEALYTFPLPHDAAVDGMTFTVGARVIKGEIKRREEAAQIYNAAKQAGQSAALLDQERPNIFTQRVANLMPGSDVVVEISFVQPIPYKAGQYEWAFPTVVGPRYTPSGGYRKPGERGAPSDPNPTPGTNAVVEDADKITPPIVPPGQRAGHDLTLDVRLQSPVALGEVTSQLHPITVKRPDDNEARVTLKNGAVLPNKDFVLRWKPKQNEVQTGLVTYASGPGGYFSLVIQPPAAPPKQQIAPKEMVFVIDQTGSQRGLPIAKAKETMRYCIQHLNPGDTFQLLGFTTQVFPCFEKPVPVNDANTATALKYIEPLEGNGGTDILKATDYVLNLPNDPARARVVCFMTDGFVGNDAQILKTIGEKSGLLKMFPFGVGNSVNRNLIDGMAREGRGVPEYVLLNEDGQIAAQRFYDRVSTPLLVNIGINWGNLPVQNVLPGGIPDLYESGPIVLTGRYSQPASGDINVTGMLGGRPWRKRIHLEFPKESTGGEGLPSLWARQRITEIESESYKGPVSGQQPKDTREEITQLALEYRLMSQYTSFVAVEPKVVNVGGQQRTMDVPIEMADGVSYQGIFGMDRVYSLGTNYRVSPGLAMSPLHATGNLTYFGIGPEFGAQRAFDLPATGKLLSPEEKKLATRTNKLSQNLRTLLDGWEKSKADKPANAPEETEIKAGRITIDFTTSPLTKDTRAALLAKLKELGLADLQELAENHLLASLPLEKVDDFLALPEIVRVQTPKFKA